MAQQSTSKRSRRSAVDRYVKVISCTGGLGLPQRCIVTAFRLRVIHSFAFRPYSWRCFSWIAVYMRRSASSATSCCVMKISTSPGTAQSDPPQGVTPLGELKRTQPGKRKIWRNNCSPLVFPKLSQDSAQTHLLPTSVPQKQCFSYRAGFLVSNFFS